MSHDPERCPTCGTGYWYCTACERHISNYWARTTHRAEYCEPKLAKFPPPTPRKLDKNHLPPELAAQILERDAQIRENPLTEAQRELLAILAEECGEVIQRATKILRFGYTVNPWSGHHNRETLEAELGDLFAVVRILHARGEVDWVKVVGHAEAKLAAFKRKDGRLRHAVVPDGA